MYIPASFAETDTRKLHDFIERHSFGILMTQTVDGPVASHLPFLLQRDAGSQGTLTGHIARANPQWKTSLTDEVMVIFSGPHAYVSPAWYAAELVVPTWNYIAVHAYGKITWIEEPVAMREIVLASVETFEKSRPKPWKLDAPDDFVDKMLRQIVGFRVEIRRLEGKWKLNQNHPQERREKVIRALNERGDENAIAIAAAMQETTSAS